MTRKKLSTPAPEINRDRWGRPLVIPAAGGKAIPYTRCTTYVGTVEDTYNLSRWQMRMVALGLADRADLRLAVAAHRDDKAKLNELCTAAQEAAKAHAAATTGTALHALTEQVDRGLEPMVPQEYAADIAAYVEATRDLRAVAIEQFCVLDALKVGGTPDRVVKFEGKTYIADLKTGSVEYGFLKIAAQLAMYARSRPYDVETGERMEPHGAELDRGIVVHAPAGQGICNLYWVDLLSGWELCRMARDIREKRQLRFAQLFRPVKPVPVAPPLTLEERLRSCSTPEKVRELWRDHAAEWTPDLTELAKRHIAALQGTTPTPTPEGTRA